MSGSHREPDEICEIFVLEQNEVLVENTGDQPRSFIEG
jgi:hypothetical protein